MSKLPFELFLALRYLRPKRTFVSAITAISVIGVTLGVAVLIIVISVMTGFDRELRNSILGFNAHLKISGAGERLGHYRELREEVQQQPGIKAVAPYIYTQVLASRPAEGESFSIGTAPVTVVKGVDSALESSVSAIPESMVDGEFDLEDRGVVLGIKLARQLGVWVGDPLSVYSVRQLESLKKAQEEGDGDVPLPDDFEVRGVFEVGFHEYDQFFALASLEDAQEFVNFDRQNLVSGLTVMVDDPEAIQKTVNLLGEAIDRPVHYLTWMEEHRDILDALIVEKNVMFYLLFFIMIVAAFGIASALITFVIQKTREIGILRALGANNRQVAWLFLSQSLAVGIMGVVSGLAMGLTAVAYRNEFLEMMRSVTGFQLFPAEIYHFTELPALVVKGDVIFICGMSIIICLMAGLIPAISAAVLQPAQALRHE